MYTYCPDCRTLFRLTSQHLARAGGRTRCGECDLVYSAVDYLFEDLPTARQALEAGRQSRAVEFAMGGAETMTDRQATSAGDDLVPGGLPAASGRWHSKALTVKDIFAATAVILLVLSMAAQWLFFNRADLVSEPAWKPVIEQFCGYLNCSLPQQVDLSQIELLNRDVRQHPVVEEALLVNATLSNQADFTQPFPVLEVSFSDSGGYPVAVRHFRPAEYLGDAYVVKHGMTPGEPVPIVLEILDPGETAVSYQFGFL